MSTEVDDANLDAMFSSDANAKKRNDLTTKGKVILGIAGASFATITAFTAPFLIPALRKICLPYVPATTQQVQNVMALLKGRPGPIIDLGSGDGRIVIEAARHGIPAEGVELNPWLVLYSRYKALREGVPGLTRFRRRNIWKHNLSTYDGVVIFGVDTMMDPLRTKLVRELREDGCVVTCRFPFVGCSPSSEVGVGLDTVWLYSKKDLLSLAVEADKTR